MKINCILTSEVKVGKIDVKLSRAWSFLSSQNLLLFNSRGVAKMNTKKLHFCSSEPFTNVRNTQCKNTRIST